MTGRQLAYVQVMAALRELGLSQPLDIVDPLAPEPVLAERFRVSRGTVRRAIDELVREGLLSAEAGRGTYVRKPAQVRALMRGVLERIALPDSRWHLDVTAFVPDFVGSDACHRRVVALDTWADAETVFIAPDNSLQRLTQAALEQGKSVLQPTYGLRRGMVLLDPDTIAPAAREFASTLDGLERHGAALDIDDLRALGSIDLMVTGAIALTTSGVHVGTGRAYLDIEWAILSELELVGSSTQVVGVIHDDQLLDANLQPDAFDISVDRVVTPTRELSTSGRFERPDGIDWQRIDLNGHTGVAYLTDLATGGVSS